MAFQFSLESVLRYRKGIERREYLALERIHQEITSLEMEVGRLEMERKELLQTREVELERGTSAFELQCLCSAEHELDQHQKALASKVQATNARKQQQMGTYTEARQKHELLGSVRERHLQSYQREETRQQQNAVDDLSLSRRRHRP